MRIAITDACIFIDLLELTMVSPFFSLDLEVHTTTDVMSELHQDQQEILLAYQSVGKLTIHTLSTEDLDKIRSSVFPKALSQQDKSVIYLASQLGAMVLSSDKAVRNFAKKQATETHGMFWVFDQLVNQRLLDKNQAVNKLRQLMNGNLMYRNNAQLWREADQRIKQWSGSE